MVGMQRSRNSWYCHSRPTSRAMAISGTWRLAMQIHLLEPVSHDSHEKNDLRLPSAFQILYERTSLAGPYLHLEVSLQRLLESIGFSLPAHAKQKRL